MYFTRERTERRSFEDCIEDELTGREKRFRNNYLHQGIYAPHLRRWIEAFGRDRLMIIDAEQFFTNPAKVASEMFTFLGLADVPVNVSPGNVGTYSAEMKPETRKGSGNTFGRTTRPCATSWAGHTTSTRAGMNHDPH